MEIKLSEQQAKEVLGEIRLINTKERRDRDTNELLSTTYHIGSPNLDSGTFSIRIESDKPCNIKPFGLVKLENPSYNPRAQSGNLGGGGTWAKVIDNFEADAVLPLDESQKIADEDGVPINTDSKKDDKKGDKEPVGAGANKK